MRSIHVGFLLCSLSTLPAGIASGANGALVAGGSSYSADAPEGELPEGLGTADWTSLRAAYEASRHQVFAVDGGHRARNPGQQWTTLFDGRGFTTTPDSGGWTWGLELVRYGWGEVQHEVAQPRSVSAEGGRIAYAWDEQLSEWYVNDARGLEHGYMVHARPEVAGGPLVLGVAIRGELLPEVSADGLDVRFLDAEGSAVLTYAGLAVFDANGQALSAGWKSRAGGLQLQVVDQGARYPLSIDPIAQQAYLKASNTEEGDHFGYSVSVSGDTVVVGARNEDSNATGVNGNGNNNLATDSGAAYVFVRNGTSWSQEAYLKASNTETLDSFGTSVSISGDTLVVGAYHEDSNTTGVNGDENNNLASDSGVAYVFVRNGTSWSQEAYLKASNTNAGDNFGGAVSVSGDTIVVGAQFEDSNATGVNGNQNNNSAPSSGSAYVFVRQGTTWSQEAYVKASNTDTSDDFGYSVSVSGDTVVVGAFDEDSIATGVNGNQGNTVGDSGAAYVFLRSGTSWAQEAYLKASNTGAVDNFGFSVAVSGDTVVVGAPLEDSNATGVNGQGTDTDDRAGAAYVFVRQGTTWSQQAYLKASNTEASEEFGQSVSVSGDTVVVGAWLEDSNATGVNGDESNNLAFESGAAYVFVRSGTTWSHAAYLKASNTGASDHFGNSVSVFGNTLVVGAYIEDSSAMGVNGNQSNNSASNSGAVYVFDLDASVAYCTAGTSASGCQALLSASGTPSATAPSGFTLSAATVEGQKDGLFFFGTNGQQANSWGNGTSYQCVEPPVVRAPLMTGAGTSGLCDGSFSQDLNALWAAVPAKNPGAGATVQAQLWYRDPLSTSNQTTSLSDAVEFSVMP